MTNTPNMTDCHGNLLSNAIQSIMAENPDLCSGGWRGGFNTEARFDRYRAEMLLPNFTDMVTDALIDLASRRIPARQSSYGQKHFSEDHVGRYITNGALITAALLAGYVPRRDGPNCTFSLPRQAKPHHSLAGGDYTRGWVDTQGAAE